MSTRASEATVVVVEMTEAFICEEGAIRWFARSWTNNGQNSYF